LLLARSAANGRKQGIPGVEALVSHGSALTVTVAPAG
jgi:hypothetical protein